MISNYVSEHKREGAPLVLPEYYISTLSHYAGLPAERKAEARSVPEQLGIEGLRIYPNPATAELNVIGNFKSTPVYWLEIKDMLGRQVMALPNIPVNKVQTFDVTFTFRYWINYFIDKAGSVEIGQSEFNSPTVTRAGGIFGGLISKLPPELRRAGRDVLNELRKKVPIGGITGGRVFPPFKIPPLNI